MNRIVKIAASITKQYKTCDPFKLCDLLDVTLTIAKLPNGINGFYNTVLGMPFIYLNSSLCDSELRAICAHELGHMILHPDINTLFIKTKTIINAQRLEHEADLFAAGLLIPTIPKCEGLTVAQLAFELEVPQSLAMTRICV